MEREREKQQDRGRGREREKESKKKSKWGRRRAGEGGRERKKETVRESLPSVDDLPDVYGSQWVHPTLPHVGARAQALGSSSTAFRGH